MAVVEGERRDTQEDPVSVGRVADQITVVPKSESAKMNGIILHLYVVVNAILPFSAKLSFPSFLLQYPLPHLALSESSHHCIRYTWKCVCV
jgi:hypothetical protein